MRGVGPVCHTTPISPRDLASKRRDVKHVGVTLPRSCLVGLKHAVARTPPLGILNLTAFDMEWGKKFRQGLTKSCKKTSDKSYSYLAMSFYVWEPNKVQVAKSHLSPGFILTICIVKSLPQLVMPQGVPMLTAQYSACCIIAHVNSISLTFT